MNDKILERLTNDEIRAVVKEIIPDVTVGEMAMLLFLAHAIEYKFMNKNGLKAIDPFMMM